MSEEKPKTYTAQFRASAGKSANEPDQSISQTVKDLGINVNTLHTWIGKYSHPQSSNKTVRTGDHLYKELKRLKKEITRLTEEHTSQSTAVKYVCIKQYAAKFPVDSMCRFMQVSRYTYNT